MSPKFLPLVMLLQLGSVACWGASHAVTGVFVDPTNRKEIKANLIDGTTVTVLRTANVKAQLLKNWPDETKYQLDSLGDRFTSAVISPDKQRFAFSIPSDLLPVGGIFNLESKTFVQIGPADRAYWSPNNEVVVIESQATESSPNRAFLYDLLSKKSKQLFIQEPAKDKYSIHTSSVDWSDDGNAGTLFLCNPQLTTEATEIKFQR